MSFLDAKKEATEPGIPGGKVEVIFLNVLRLCLIWPLRLMTDIFLLS